MSMRSFESAGQALLVATIFAATSFGQPQTPQEIARHSFDSVVLISTTDARGQPLCLGSGFIVRDGVVATNLHVLEGAAGGHCKLVTATAKHRIVGTVAVDEAGDLALLKVDGLAGPSLALSKDDLDAIGDSVYAVGNPKGLEGTFSQGIVSGVRTIGSDRILQITAPISPGNSGGPVLNTRGEVVGVSVATYRDGQNLNFAIPVSYLRALIGVPEKLTPLSARDKAVAGASILRGLGGEETAPVVGSHFLWGNPDALEWYTFSLHNNLKQPVRAIDVLVIFLDKAEVPVATKSVTVLGPIEPMLVVRSAPFSTTSDIRKLCNTAEIRVVGFEIVPEPGTGPQVPQHFTVGGLLLDVPGDWVRARSHTDGIQGLKFEELKFRLPRAAGDTKDYDVSIMHFPDHKKDAEEDLRYWASRFGLDPKAVTREAISSGDLKITFFELSGRFVPPTQDATPIENYRMLDAEIRGTGGPWWVRAVGPDAVISRARDGFSKLVRSIRRE